MKSNYKKLGKYIREVDERNRDLKIEKLLGVSISKMFIPSIANTIGTDFSNYKIVRRGQFAYGPVTSRNGDKVSIALLDEDDCIISSSYTVFEIINTNELLPEYLMMWFRRPEFDRYARYMSHGSVRELFGWDELCSVELPVPDTTKQQKIVDEYNVLCNRITLNEQMNQKLEETAQAIYKQWFVDFEFPDENGQPYKSNGGEFEESELGDIPKGWKILSLNELIKVIDNRGKTPSNSSTITNYPLIEIASLKSAGRAIDYNECTKYVNYGTYVNWFRSGHPKSKDILMSTVGSLAELKIFWGEKGCIAQNVVAFRPNTEFTSMFLFQYLSNKRNELLTYEIGSVQASIKVSQIVNFNVIVPSDDILKKFDKYLSMVTDLIYRSQSEITSIKATCSVMLQRLSNFMR